MDENLYGQTEQVYEAGPPQQEPVKINYLKVWGIFVLTTVAGSFLGGFVMGLVVGIVFGVLGYSPEQVAGVARVFGFILGLVVSFLAFQWSVKKYIVSKLSGVQ